MVRYELRNMLFTPVVVIAVLGLYLFMIVSLYPSPGPDLLYNYQYAISLGYGSLFIPVAAVMPLCYFLYHMGAPKHMRFALVRSRLSSYTCASVLSAALSGMAVTLGAFLLFTVTCLLYSPRGTPTIGGGLFQYSGAFYIRLSTRPLLLYLVMGAVYTVNGAIWPMLSLLCSSFTSNSYVAAAAPFLVKTALSYFAQSFGLLYLDPGQLLLKGVARDLPGGGIPYALTYIGMAVLLCGGIWSIRTYRKVRYA